jgi:hypothetical protein
MQVKKVWSSFFLLDLMFAMADTSVWPYMRMNLLIKFKLVKPITLRIVLDGALECAG